MSKNQMYLKTAHSQLHFEIKADPGCWVLALIGDQVKGMNL